MERNYDNRTQAGNIRNPKRHEAIEWIKEAMSNIEIEKIVNSFKYCNLLKKDICVGVAYSHCERFREILDN